MLLLQWVSTCEMGFLLVSNYCVLFVVEGKFKGKNYSFWFDLFRSEINQILRNSVTVT